MGTTLQYSNRLVKAKPPDSKIFALAHVELLPILILCQTLHHQLAQMTTLLSPDVESKGVSGGGFMDDESLKMSSAMATLNEKGEGSEEEKAPSPE